MDRRHRIITHLPLDVLWNEAGEDLQATRVRTLGVEDIRVLLRAHPLRFIVANVGHAPHWIGEEEYPSGYCYTASEWRLADGATVVLLEMYH